LEAGIAKAESLLGGIDVLVNLIGIMNRGVSVDELTDAEWDEVMTTNLSSITTLCRRAIPTLRRSDKAAIVNVSSGLGVRPLAASSVYSVSKAGVIALTKAIAFECAPKIRANSVAPGIVETAFLSGGTGHPPRDEAAPRSSLDAYRNSVPMKRLGQPTDIVGPILFLASPAACFINGQTIHVNGGGLMP
jgi:NAD(P)-dependent dehydrogenase (short-subunit alcohol dehydrogenase family)